jgi:uncharacterized protein YecT (DUF1311 family)
MTHKRKRSRTQLVEDALRDAPRLWIKYRDANCGFSAASGLEFAASAVDAR